MKTAQTLQKEVLNLKCRLKKKAAQLELKHVHIEKQNTYIKSLEAALIELKKHRFGPRSEKNDPNQIQLFNEAELITDEKNSLKKPKKKKKSGKRKALPDDLPSIEVKHDLADDRKFCPKDGTQLKFIGEVKTQELKIKPAKVIVVNNIQYKYACPCCNTHIDLADKPKKLIPKSIATAELLSHVCISKYADGLPLYRQSEMFKRIKINLSRQVLANWMIKTGIAVQPLVNLIRDELYDQPYVHIDETRLQVLKEADRKASTLSYIWAQKGGDNIIFSYYPTRSACVVEELLSSYKGALMTDGYKVYDDIAIKYMIIHLACWTHARRYFKRVLDIGKNPHAQKMINLIGKLYAIEKQIKDMEPDEKYLKRQESSKPILEEIRQFLDEILHNTNPSGKMGQALVYLQNQWHKLIRYIEDGNYPIDNNPAENAIRPFVIGRKNWLFSYTPAGAHASANLYSIIETAKAHGINPAQYLTHIFKLLPLAKSVKDYENLLPRNFKVQK